MNMQKIQPYFLVVLLVGTLFLAFFIFKPFVQGIVLAGVAAIVCGPLHRHIRRGCGKNEGIAAFISTIIILVLILTPLIFIGIQIVQESQSLYTSLSSGDNKGGFFGAANDALAKIQGVVPGASETATSLDQYVKQALQWLAEHLGGLFSSATKIFLNIFIFAIALYYFLKDGHRFKKALVALSPLADRDDESIMHKLRSAVNSVIKGSLAVAIIQGFLTGIGFAIFGVPNFVLWGLMTAVAALIPGVGTAIVIVPGIIFLYLTSTPFMAFGLLIWGTLAVGLIDNFLGPKLVGRGLHLHPLLVLLSVLGGITFFGPIGFILGPLTLSFLFALLDVYSLMPKSE